MEPATDPLLLKKSGGAGNRNRDLWICSQELCPLQTANEMFLPFFSASLTTEIITAHYNTMCNMDTEYNLRTRQ
jgi:hypothetical protein